MIMSTMNASADRTAPAAAVQGMEDVVERPTHYTRPHPGMECIQLTGDCSFCMGNAIKYVWRYRSKGHPVEDLRKAQWYLQEVDASQETIAWTRDQRWILYRLSEQADDEGVEPEARIWHALDEGDTTRALRALADLIEQMYEYDGGER